MVYGLNDNLAMILMTMSWMSCVDYLWELCLWCWAPMIHGFNIWVSMILVYMHIWFVWYWLLASSSYNLPIMNAMVSHPFWWIDKKGENMFNMDDCMHQLQKKGGAIRGICFKSVYCTDKHHMRLKVYHSYWEKFCHHQKGGDCWIKSRFRW